MAQPRFISIGSGSVPLPKPALESASDIPTRDEVMGWLRDKKIALWGESFMVIEGKEGPGLAADWFISQLESLEDWRKREQGK